MQVDVTRLKSTISGDNSLTAQEKETVLSALQDDKLKSSLIGGGLGLLAAKYLKLSSTAQVLLTLAGFGIGKALLNRVPKTNKSLKYNNTVKAYEVQS